MQSQFQHLLEKLEYLSPERLEEVEDFVDFLRQLDTDRMIQRDFAHASDASFAEAWENDDDAIYDTL